VLFKLSKLDPETFFVSLNTTVVFELTKSSRRDVEGELEHAARRRSVQLMPI
jgi:hypothetical protein